MSTFGTKNVHSAIYVHTSALSTGVTGDDVILLSGSGEHLNSKLLPLPSLLDSLIGDNGVQSRDVLLSLT